MKATQQKGLKILSPTNSLIANTGCEPEISHLSFSAQIGNFWVLEQRGLGACSEGSQWGLGPLW